MAYTEADYQAARDWAVGKTGSEIFGAAQNMGLTAADLQGVFGASANDLMSGTGYGTEAGLRSDADQWRYLGGDDNGGQWANRRPPQERQAASGIPAMQQNVNLRQYEKNPYLDQMAAGITQQATRNLTENVLPGLRQQSIASGGYGGSRGAIAEGLAMGRTGDAIANSLSSLYGNDYQQTQNRNTQMYGMDQSYNLGLGNLGLQQQKINNDYALGLANLGLGYTQADNQRYGIDQTYSLGLKNAENQRYGTDKSYEVGMANASASSANAANNYALGQQQLGMTSLFGLLDRQQTYNQNAINNATAIQNTPLNYWQHFSQGANSIGQGYGTSTQSGGGGNPLMGAVGGAQLGTQIGNWWNSQGNWNSMPNSNVFMGNGSMGD